MKVLIIGYVWPEPNSSAAGSRMIQLIKFFIDNSFSVTFATTAIPTRYSSEMSSLGVQTEAIKLNSSSFNDFLDRLQPDMVMFDRFMMEEQFGWRVEKICPAAIKILDTEDLHFLRKHREMSFRQKKSVPFTSSEIAKREIASILRCDLSLIISEIEMKLLQTEFNISEDLLFYLPFLFDKITTEDKMLLPEFESRENFISIGNFKHPPNVDAAIYLRDEIWPLIRKALPNVKMLVYGAYPPEKINKLNDPKINFLVKGRAENAAEVVKMAKISLAPLRFGAGLKGKIAEAMLCGTPTVTTPVGAEGMNGELPWNGEIQNSPAEFARAAVELYTSRKKWEQARENGFTIINSRFSKLKFYNSLKIHLEELNNMLGEHREQNFIGSMLRHHRVKSTYYLSKYIEVKTELERITKK